MKEQTKQPYLKTLMDNPIFCLVAGLSIMVIFYTLWGALEVMSLPQADLP